MPDSWNNRLGKWTGFFGLLLLITCSAQRSGESQRRTEKWPEAFPGAEGFGRYAAGGRGGRVMIVTNLNDKGPGSFREAAEAKGARMVVFEISGTIHLEKKLNIRGNITIAGQTAPGDGICLADQPVVLAGDNIIVRYLRFRMGDRFQRAERVDGNGSDDAFGGVRRNRIIIDHCSLSWSTDEVFSVYAGDSTTLQWNIISEPLNYSYHFEAGDKDFEKHGYGAIWGGRHLSAHHNLFAHCNNRNPRFDGIRNAPEEFCDYRNNVIYNWGTNTIYAGEGGRYNIIGNYFKHGPDTRKSVRYRIVNPGRREPDIPFGQWYVDGNFVDGSDEISRDNSQGVIMSNGGTAADKQELLVTDPFPAEPVSTQTARAAYESVLSLAGASFRRDTLDARIVRNVRERTGRLIDVQGGYPHGTPYEQTVKAWPTLASLPPARDSDRDGMPDDWEIQHGLNPNDSTDAWTVTGAARYGAIEEYVNGLIR